jgi:hypothetical protein
MNVPSKSTPPICRPSLAKLCGNLLLTTALFKLTCFNLSAATIADWKFNAANPSADSSGNGNTLAFYGDALSFTGDIATNAPGATNSATFDGAAYVQTANPLNLTSYNALTIEFFAKYNPVYGLEMFYAQNNPNNVQGAFYFDVGESSSSGLKIAQRTALGFETETAPGPTNGSWHHFAVTIDESGNSPVIKTYLDGYEVDNGEGSAGLQSFINDYFTIGAYPPSYNFNYNGEMGEMRISSGILSPSQFLIGVQPAVIVISQQPTSVSVAINNPAVFSVVATAQGGNPTPALQYQWQMNGTNISGATNSSYTVSSASSADNGESFDAVLSAAGASSVTSSNAILTVVTNVTIADWRLNEANPTADSSGNGNDLAFYGDTVTFTSDVATNAPGATNSATFDGASYLQTAGTLNLSLYNAITIELFARYNPVYGLEMFYSQNNPNYVTGAFYFDVGESSLDPSELKTSQRTPEGFVVDQSPGPSDDSWHHFALTIDDTGKNQVTKIYIDGYETDNGGIAAAGTQSFINDYFTIGAYPPSYNFNYNGELGEMRISSGILSPSQFLIGVQPSVITINQQPKNVAALAGSPAAFSVLASVQGANPNLALSYQWKMNGINISGATNGSYTLPSASLTNNGALVDVVVSALGASSVTSSNAILTVLTNLTIADWKFNEANPTADSSGNGNDLTFYGDAITFGGDIDSNAPAMTNSATFDGAAYAQTTAPLNLSRYNAVTIELFAKYAPPSGLEMFYAQNNPNYVVGAFYLDAGENGPTGLKWSQQTETGFTVDVAPGPADDNWHHIALSIDESGTVGHTKLYLDGVEIDGTGSTGPLQSFINDYFTIGAYPPSYVFGYVGEMGELRISNGVLDSDQFLSGPALLQIDSTSGQIVITWPQNAMNFTLQQSSSVLGPWTNLTNSPISSGLNYQVSVPVTPGTEFYRLMR